ncbi:RluA family pseudouridine synthase [Mycoplasmopsis gallinarum]
MIRLEVKYKERIDKYISDNSEITRNDAKALILEGAISVNEIQVRKPNFTVKENDVINIYKLIEKITNIDAKEMELEIIYEDNDIVVINKPSNLVVHPAPGHFDDTLVNGLLYHFKNLSNENGLLRPGIVHRIDKDTSGLLLIAKNNEAHLKLAEMLKTHEIKRSYVAIVDGILENKFLKINLPLGRSKKDRKLISVQKDGKEAITNVELLKTFYYEKQPYSLVKCDLETGRTHQIRVHLAYIKHPVYGDASYGKKVDDFGQRLHAYKLEFNHPITNQLLTIFAPIPAEFSISDYDFSQLTQERKN